MEKKDLSDGHSSEHHQHCNELLIYIDEDNLEPKQECCIYRVPKYLRDVNPEAYTPWVVSIGPLHHGKPELASMEKHKKRFARMFYERIGFEKRTLVDTFIKENKETVFNCYEDTFNLKSHEREEMLLLDAVFVIEYILREVSDDDSDVLHRISCKNCAIAMDFMLLENQLPYFLLKGLYKTAFGDPNDDQDSFINSCSKFFSLFISGLKFENVEGLDIKHFTDLLRYACLNPRTPSNKSIENLQNLPSATKLHKSGLKFKSIRGGSNYMTDIKFMKRKLFIPFFEVCELHIPLFLLEDRTESFVRNVMALEQCHYPRDTHFCNYIILLDYLIDTKEDVELLVEQGILRNSLGDPKVLAEIMNKVTKNIMVSESCFIYIAKKLENYYHNNWNKAKAILVNVYFSNPWRGTATIAAVMLLLLTLMQTICSILQVIYG